MLAPLQPDAQGLRDEVRVGHERGGGEQVPHVRLVGAAVVAPLHALHAGAAVELAHVRHVEGDALALLQVLGVLPREPVGERLAEVVLPEPLRQTLAKLLGRGERFGVEGPGDAGEQRGAAAQDAEGKLPGGVHRAGAVVTEHVSDELVARAPEPVL